MKYNGIVRRLDSLGRIVIPREYRKMHKIKESDPLEIIALDSGEILIKKVNLSSQLTELASQFLRPLHEALYGTLILSDYESMLDGEGQGASHYKGSAITPKVRNVIQDRKSFNGAGSDMGIDSPYVLVCPIHKEDAFGALILVSDMSIPPEDEKLVYTSAKILGEMMQRY